MVVVEPTIEAKEDKLPDVKPKKHTVRIVQQIVDTANADHDMLDEVVKQTDQMNAELREEQKREEDKVVTYAEQLKQKQLLEAKVVPLDSERGESEPSAPDTQATRNRQYALPQDGQISERSLNEIDL